MKCGHLARMFARRCPIIRSRLSAITNRPGQRAHDELQKHKQHFRRMTTESARICAVIARIARQITMWHFAAAARVRWWTQAIKKNNLKTATTALQLSVSKPPALRSDADRHRMPASMIISMRVPYVSIGSRSIWCVRSAHIWRNTIHTHFLIDCASCSRLPLAKQRRRKVAPFERDLSDLYVYSRVADMFPDFSYVTIIFNKS